MIIIRVIRVKGFMVFAINICPYCSKRIQKSRCSLIFLEPTSARILIYCTNGRIAVIFACKLFQAELISFENVVSKFFFSQFYSGFYATMSLIGIDSDMKLIIKTNLIESVWDNMGDNVIVHVVYFVF